MDSPVICPKCKGNVLPTDFFCPTCGRKLKEKPQPTTVVSQILIYLLSILLPPLGIWPAVKYLRQPDQKSKTIGWVAIFLTVISIVVTIWLSVGYFNSLQKQLEPLLNQYQDLGL